MNKGVVLIAAGSPYYGSWAFNVAMGIKQTTTDVNVSLLYHGHGKDYLNQYISIFDKTIQIPDECVNRNGMESLLRAKVCLYDLSPYDETIYIDADVIWNPYRKITDLFEEVKDVDLTIGNRGECSLSTDPRLIWSDLASMKNKFGENAIIYNLSSEFIYFKKKPVTKNFFDLAKKAFDEPEVDYVRFAGTVPDELAFQIAYLKTGLKPHQLPYLPFYWEPYEKKNIPQSEFVKSQFYGYSVGGCTLASGQKAIYDNLAQVYARGFGLKYPFLSYNKRDIFTNRIKI